MSDESISAKDVSVDQVQLLREDVLVRAAPAEDVLSSGLVIPNRAAEAMIGGVFYGVIVACGPGALVRRPPSAESITRYVLDRCGEAPFTEEVIREVADDLAGFLQDNGRDVNVPSPWKPGDHVAVRKGFGPEVEFREGRHHVIGRGNSEYGHGILAAWDPAHVHCWHDNERGRHSTDEEGHISKCCGCEQEAAITTRLPSCSSKVPGPRLAEAKPAHLVYHANPGYVEPSTPGFEAFDGVRAAGGEERPEEVS